MSLDESSPDLRDVAPDLAQRGARRIIAVGGGKGGSGKSMVAASVGIYLATLGKKVVLLDADLGGANLHTFVGLERPAYTLADVVDRRLPIEQVVVETAVPGLGLIAGEGDPSWMASPRPPQRARLLSQIQQLKTEYLVIDLGPGTSSTVLDFFLLADIGVLVVQPEPTSVENAVRFMKSAFLRRLRRAGLEHVTAATREGDRAVEGGIPAPLDLYLAAGAQAVIDTLPPVGPDKQTALLQEIRAFRPKIIVNQARAKPDMDLGPALAAAARRRLGIPVDYLGHLEHDDAVWLAVRKRRPLVVDQPESRVAKGIERVTRRLLALENEKPAAFEVRPDSELSHYEVLEVDPGATDEEIRRSYRRVRELHGADSLVVPGLYNRERLAALHLRIDEAYETLIDEERRRTYDQSMFPEGQAPRRRGASTPGVAAPSPVPSAGDRSGPIPLVEDAGSSPTVAPAVPKVPLPPEPEITATTEFTGALLKQLREARGIDLHVIAYKTKITVAHLRALEDESVKAMPATVYVRGFLVEYARFFKLDVQRVLATYLARLKTLRAGLPEDRE